MDTDTIRDRWRPQPGSRLDELLNAYDEAKQEETAARAEAQRQREAAGGAPGPTLKTGAGIRAFQALRALQQAVEQLEAPDAKTARIEKAIAQQESLFANLQRQNTREAKRVRQLRAAGRMGVLTRHTDLRPVEERIEGLRQDLAAWKRAAAARRRWWCENTEGNNDGHDGNTK